MQERVAKSHFLFHSTPNHHENKYILRCDPSGKLLLAPLVKYEPHPLSPALESGFMNCLIRLDKEESFNL